MANSAQAIEDQMKVRGWKRDSDVRELYLSRGELTSVIDLGRFKNLTLLWLNNNLLRTINMLSLNCHLSELHLNHNLLNSVTGAISHLICLEKLILHNNQLQNLEVVVSELHKMQCLEALNLFNNPVAQERDYRIYVIHHVPSLQLLDRRAITEHERREGRHRYDQVNEHIKENIAFGLRSQGPPSVYYHHEQNPQRYTKPVPFEIGNNFYRNQPHFATDEQAINRRILRWSVAEFSHFDWSKAPRAEERRLPQNRDITPQIITTQFR